jgi:hypothetical protein
MKTQIHMLKNLADLAESLDLEPKNALLGKTVKKVVGPRRTRTAVEIDCLVCKKIVQKSLSEYRRHPVTVCSTTCRQKLQMLLNLRTFWSHCEKKESGCWEWNGFFNNTGYGKFTFQKKTILASKVAYILTHGSIQDGLLVCHTCDNPKYINPAHLWAGTHQQNMDDMVRKGRGRGRYSNPLPQPPTEAKEQA